MCGRLSDDHVATLAAWRGLTGEFVQWLKSSGLLGLYDGHLSLPEHDPETGMLTGVHFLIGKPEDKKWIRIKGTLAQPLIIGDRNAAKYVVVESQWDAFAVMQQLEFHRYDASYCVLITRGADNGKFASLIPKEAEAIVIMQNDEERKKAALLPMIGLRTSRSIARAPVESSETAGRC